MQNEGARLEARVRGRVQGVGFRAFVYQQAHRLGLSGFVRNDWDGSVQVLAEGPRDRLEHLLAALREGPHAARVDAVEVHCDAPSAHPSAPFEVRG